MSVCTRTVCQVSSEVAAAFATTCATAVPLTVHAARSLSHYQAAGTAHCCQQRCCRCSAAPGPAAPLLHRHAAAAGGCLDAAASVKAAGLLSQNKNDSDMGGGLTTLLSHNMCDSSVFPVMQSAMLHSRILGRHVIA